MESLLQNAFSLITSRHAVTLLKKCKLTLNHRRGKRKKVYFILPQVLGKPFFKLVVNFLPSVTSKAQCADEFSGVTNHA